MSDTSTQDNLIVESVKELAKSNDALFKYAATLDDPKLLDLILETQEKTNQTFAATRAAIEYLRFELHMMIKNQPKTQKKDSIPRIK